MFKKDGEIDCSKPTAEQLESFSELKRRLANPLVLGLPKRGCPDMVDTDASKFSLGAVLLQQKDKNSGQLEKWKKEGNRPGGDSEKEWVTIGYWSKTPIAAEKNYSTN